MKSLRMLSILLLAYVLLFSSCSAVPPTGADDFAYAAAPFSASIRGTYTSADGVARPIAASVTVGTAAVLGDGSTRPMTIAFTEPPALAGVTVTAAYIADGQGRMTRSVTFSAPSAYGEVHTESQAGEFDGLLRFAEALLPHGDVISSTPVHEDGTHTVSRSTADGSRCEDYLFLEGRVLPLRVTVTTARESITLTID